MDDERVAFEAVPHFCDKCRATFQQTPWAFPLMDLRFPESLRFCSSQCLEHYRHDNAGNAGRSGPPQSTEEPKP